MRENARAAVRGLLGGEVPVVEDSDGVFAVVDLGRVYIADGAGGALPELYTARIQLTD